MEIKENNNDKIKNKEEQIEDKENIPNPEATGFFTLSYKNGDKFSGQMSKGEVNSYGIYEGSNGITFEGDFIKDDKETKDKRIKGKLIYDNDNEKYIYEGEFLNGKFDGNGILKNSKGDIYEGSFKSGLKEGEGIFHFAEGDIYIGNFTKNNFDGEGKLIIKDISEYKGKFKNGKYEGYGMLKSLITNDILIGVFKEGKMNGEGFQI